MVSARVPSRHKRALPVGPLYYKDCSTANNTQYQEFMKVPKDTQGLHEIVDV